MLNAVIVEDVHDNIDTLKYLLEKCPVDINVIGVADNLGDAENILSLNDIDVAFLDIQLKDGLIFEVLDKLNMKNSFPFELVFVTAFSTFEMAIKAIQFACLDYINKPLDQDQLNKVVLKVNQSRNSSSQHLQLNLLLEAIKGNVDYPKSISVVLPKGVMEIVSVANILYFKADRNTCLINLEEGRALHSIKTFSYYLELFNNHPDFIQISRSYYVNKHKIKRYNGRNKELTLHNGEKLVVSHRMSNALKKALDDNSSGFDLSGLLKRFFNF
ncbi:MAG: response regulator transcription factor [Saprospiraceae bacterium]|nr:LytTR family DNA-binding domain-containing protein [Bacteroidia bacterium]NNL91985.1 response regulator transcription factor [Saprospiraceae bacterium]